MATKDKKEKKEKTIDPFKLEDVPGLGPVTIAALLKEHVVSTFQLVHKSPIWLKEVTGMDKDKAGEAFQFMKQNLVDAGVIDPQEMSGTEALQQRMKVKRLKTGSDALDDLLGGGIEVGQITEFYGQEGSGKTQTGHSLAIQVQKPIADGGLAEDGKPALVLYLDTENTFRPERLKQIIIAKKLATKDEEVNSFLDNVIVQKSHDAFDQCKKVENMIPLVENVPIKLIIIDSAVALFRNEYLGRGTTKSKFDLMNEMFGNLKRLAELSKVAIVIINQIYNKPDEMFGADPDIPYGGHILGHAVPTRVKIFKSGRKTKAKLMKSPMLPNDDCIIGISDAGICDAE